MGLNNFILNCEKENKQLEENIKYFKNKSKRLSNENTNLKQALNEIREYCNFQIKDNETLIERLEGTNSFRIGKAKSMIIEFKNILQIMDKYMKED